MPLSKPLGIGIQPFYPPRRVRAGVLGFEPRLTDPESVVLPLHHTPVCQKSDLELCYYHMPKLALRQDVVNKSANPHPRSFDVAFHFAHLWTVC